MCLMLMTALLQREAPNEGVEALASGGLARRASRGSLLDIEAHLRGFDLASTP
jgi:hypothetical protein